MSMEKRKVNDDHRDGSEAPGPRRGSGPRLSAAAGARRVLAAGLALAALSVAGGVRADGVAISGDPPELEALTPVRVGIAHDALYDLDLREKGGLAVGVHGSVLSTSDGGQTWTPLTVPTDKALLGVATAGDRGIIVGQEGVILVSEDLKSWTAVDSGAGAVRLLSVALAEDGTAVAVGAFGTVLLSRDFGATWEQSLLDWAALGSEDGYEPHLYDARVANGRLLVAGEFGFVLASTDGGQTWTKLHSGDESIFAFHIAANGVGFAVGQDGLVLRTRDDGATWERLDAGTDANLLNVWNSTQGEVVIVGIRVLLRSRNDGDAWTRGQGHDVDRNWYQGLGAAHRSAEAANGTIVQEVVYAAGHAGIIARIND